MPRDRSRRHPQTGPLPGEGGQGREAPQGSLDGPVQLSPSLIAGAVGSDEPDGPQVNLGLGGGHVACLTVPYPSLRYVAEGVG